VLGYILGDFFTNSSGHPGGKHQSLLDFFSPLTTITTKKKNMEGKK
jgi:hypothetical protein